MGWLEKQNTPLGRVGFFGYAGRWIITAIASTVLMLVVIWVLVRVGAAFF